MFLSWCRGSLPPFKTKKNFPLSLNIVLSVEKLWNTFSRFCWQKMFFCVCSPLLKSLLWICNFLLVLSKTKTNFYIRKNLLMFLQSKKCFLEKQTSCISSWCSLYFFEKNFLFFNCPFDFLRLLCFFSFFSSFFCSVFQVSFILPVFSNQNLFLKTLSRNVLF